VSKGTGAQSDALAFAAKPRKGKGGKAMLQGNNFAKCTGVKAR